MMIRLQVGFVTPREFSKGSFPEFRPQERPWIVSEISVFHSELDGRVSFLDLEVALETQA